jgi:hypothetical protein
LPSLRSKVPSARGFVHELKLDGYRIQAHLHDGRVRLYTRSGLDWTTRFPWIAAEVTHLPARIFTSRAKSMPSMTPRSRTSARPRGTLDDLFRDHQLLDAFEARQVEHSVEQEPFRISTARRE